MAEADRIDERLRSLEEEMRLQRGRSHSYGNQLVAHDSHIADLREDVRDLKAEMGRRFDQLAGQAWRIAGFVVTVMILAATIVSLIVH